MAEAYLIDAVRTPVGKRGGGLAGVGTVEVTRTGARGVSAWRVTAKSSGSGRSMVATTP